MSRRTRGQIWVITLAAIGIVIVLNQFAGRPGLGPMDFVVGGQDAVQFCDPNHPRFYPSSSEPQRVVTMAIEAPGDPSRGARLVLKTVSGRIIRRADLRSTEGRRLRLFVVDRGLDSFVEKDPVETRPGVWLFTLQPVVGRSYRIFADFTPDATAREMYTWGDMKPAARGLPATPPGPGEYRFRFSTVPAVLYARQPFTVKMTVARRDGGAVAVQPVAGVRADLVAFDSGLTGMAKFEDSSGSGDAPDPRRSKFSFSGAIADSGRYVFWADVRLGGRTVYRRFAATILP
ncbi:MAG: hypothetical protein ACREFX_01585 [Opitutaceae bacterium]